MLPHAPGVQMADIPEDSVDLNKEEEKEDGEDKEKRSSMKLMDKRVEPDNEFESGKSGNKNSINHGETNGGGAEPMGRPLDIPWLWHRPEGRGASHRHFGLCCHLFGNDFPPSCTKVRVRWPHSF